MRVQRTSKHDLGPTNWVSMVQSPDPIWPSELHYTRARDSSPGSCVQRLFDTLANHCTHNTWPQWKFWLAHGDWLCNVGYGPMRNHIFPTQRLVPYSRTDTGKWGNSHANKLKERGYYPCLTGACHGCVALRDLKTVTLKLEPIFITNIICNVFFKI